MNTTLKNKLLLGSAIVAVGAFAAGGAQAQTITWDDTPNDGTFGAGDTQVASDADNLDATTNAEDVQVARAVADVFTLTTTLANHTIGDGTADGVAAISGATITGHTVVITGHNADATVTVTVDGNVSHGAVDDLNLTVAGADLAGGNDPLVVAFNNNVDLGGGTFTVSTNDDTSVNTATATVAGNITAGAIALNADNNNGGALTDAVLTLNGTSGTQTISAVIDGVNAAEGAVVVSGSSVVFQADVGNNGGQGVASIVVNGGNATNAVAFQDDIDSTAGVVVGDAGDDGDAYNITFGSSTENTALTGVLNTQADNTDTITFNFQGGNTIATAGAIGAAGGLDALNVTGASTILDAAAAITADTVTIGEGATLQAANNITGAVTVTGELTTDAGTPIITGDVNGAGVIDADVATTVRGQIGNSTALSNIEIAGDFTVDAATAASGATANVNATRITLEGAASDLILAPEGGQNITVSAPVVASSTGDGSIEITNPGADASVTLSGQVGANGAVLNDVTVADNAAVITLNVASDLWADAVTIGRNDQLVFTGATQAVSGAIAGNAGGGSDIVVGNDTTQTPTLTLAGGIGANVADLTVNQGSTVILGAASALTGTTTVDTGATLRVNDGLTLQTANTAITGNLQLEAAGNDVGRYNDTGGANLARANTSIYVAEYIDITAFNAANRDVLTNGGSVFDGTDGDAISTNSGAYRFTATNAGVLTVAVNDFNTVSGNASAYGAVGNTLLGITRGADTQIDALQDLVVSTGTAGYDAVAESITDPNLAGGSVVGALNVVNLSSGVTNTRLAALRDGSTVTGMTAGNISQGLQVWGEAFGLTAEQDERESISGFDVDTLGFAVGIDTETLAEDWVWGLGFAYADSDVDSDGLNNAETEIDSYQVSLYANYDLDDRTYVSGQLGYTWSDNDTTRNPGGLANQRAEGDFDSDTFTARLEAGRSYMWESAKITPKGLVNFMHYDSDSYQETGDSALNIDGDSLQLFEVGVGVDASWNHQQADGSYLQPRLEAGVRHDLIGDEVESTNSFVASPGTSFESQGFDPAQTTFNLGAGLTYFSTTNWTLSADYDFEVKSDYDSHAGTLRAAYKF